MPEPVGRELTRDLIDDLCGWLVDDGSGMCGSLRRFVRQPDTPGMTTMMKWLGRGRLLNANPKDPEEGGVVDPHDALCMELAARYAHARETQDELRDDERLDIADQVPMDKDAVAKARLMVYVRERDAKRMSGPFKNNPKREASDAEKRELTISVSGSRVKLQAEQSVDA